VFKVDLTTGALTALASFNGADGNYGSGIVCDNIGNLYGTTNSGGANDWGTVFKVDQRTHVLTTVLSFAVSNGESPIGLYADAVGNLYGSTYRVARNDDGTVYRIVAGATTLVHS